MQQTTYHIEKMDCAAEEQMVRMRIEHIEGVHRLTFDLPARRLDVFHTADRPGLTGALEDLGLGAREIECTDAVAEDLATAPAPEEKGPLVTALAINAAFFVGGDPLLV